MKLVTLLSMLSVMFSSPLCFASDLKMWESAEILSDILTNEGIQNYFITGDTITGISRTANDMAVVRSQFGCELELKLAFKNLAGVKPKKPPEFNSIEVLSNKPVAGGDSAKCRSID